MWPVPGKWISGPVLGDDAIDEVEVAGDAAEVVENTAGHEDDCDIAPSRVRDSTEHGCDPGGRRA